MSVANVRLRFNIYEGKALFWLQKAEAIQVVIDQVERTSKERRGPTAEVELRKHQPYIDLVNDRNKYEKLAQLYATFALMYKGN